MINFSLMPTLLLLYLKLHRLIIAFYLKIMISFDEHVLVILTHFLLYVLLYEFYSIFIIILLVLLISSLLWILSLLLRCLLHLLFYLYGIVSVNSFGILFFGPFSLLKGYSLLIVRLVLAIYSQIHFFGLFFMILLILLILLLKMFCF